MSMVPVVHLTKVNIGLDNGLAPNNRQAIVWTKHVLAHWRIYASFGQMIQNCICPKNLLQRYVHVTLIVMTLNL